MLDKTSTAPLYLVEINLGKLGNVFPEIDRLTNSRASIISNIVSGEWDRPLRVLEITENENRCIDVSEDIAREICNRVVDGEPMPTGGAFDFCEEYLGCQHMAELGGDTDQSRSDFTEHNTHHHALS